jgi:hypothetical protein
VVWANCCCDGSGSTASEKIFLDEAKKYVFQAVHVFSRLGRRLPLSPSHLDKRSWRPYPDIQLAQPQYAIDDFWVPSGRPSGSCTSAAAPVAVSLLQTQLEP